MTATIPRTNAGLHGAKRGKNDEFYTSFDVIDAELVHYRNRFAGRTVLLNCDDPAESQFWSYFEQNFGDLGLERLIATHHNPDGPVYRLDLVRGGGLVRTELDGDGDFRSPECVTALEEADVVVTNPPFSLFRDYITQVMDAGKQFLVLGNLNAISYEEVWPHIQAGRLWFGPSISSGDRPFRVPEWYPLEASACWVDDAGDRWIRVSGVRWFTNLDHARRRVELPLLSRYFDAPERYPRYDNFDAINVDKVADIPGDYFGLMGVPVTFLDKFNPDQFDLVGSFNNGAAGTRLGAGRTLVETQGRLQLWSGPVVARRPLYKRLIIRRNLLAPEGAGVGDRRGCRTQGPA